LPFIVHRSPFTVHRSPFTVHRSPFTVHRSPFAVAVRTSNAEADFATDRYETATEETCRRIGV
jgi:hypothetical protein